MIIGFTGRKGSGKDTAAAVFAAQNYEVVKFATPLKEMLAALMFVQGADEEMVFRCIDGDLKEVPTDYLAGRTPRHAMQTLGTEWGRNLMGEDFWVNALKNLLSDSKGAVVSDVRFPNEVAMIKSLGGEIYRVVRPGLRGMGDNHPSEVLIDTLDVTGELMNDCATPQEFQEQVYRLFFHAPLRIQ